MRISGGAERSSLKRGGYNFRGLMGYCWKCFEGNSLGEETSLAIALGGP